ncbi:MAG: mechanosensitive ion channel family protein [Thermomicrobiales bacterium]|nr:mechanosensitive ion channel family protein [Thermomicrobiales bacterium]MCO5218397.1 mechanosensitive ion channel family protein [Thermomicrobiales bacterium]MCO5223854.1 mechanosensitive ion channel family protein [Thermomicrobiales bacterium]MCO5227418.1 mechanosensitive ion channel family protein [Thermomicrobiales bacterium]
MLANGANQVLDEVVAFLIGAGRVVLVFAFSLSIAWLINRLMNKRLKEMPLITRYGKNGSMFAFRIVTATVYIIAFLTALSRLGVDTSGILTLASAFTVAIGLSMQDVMRNLIAGMYMLAEKTFQVGDRIKIRNLSGVVQGVDVRTTMIRTDEGALLMVPNQVMFTDVLQNETRFNRRAARYQIASNYSGEEIATKVDEVVLGLTGVKVVKDSLQLVQHDTETNKWDVLFTLSGREAATDLELADALISSFPDCTIERVSVA